MRPMTTVDELLATARASLNRLTPEEAHHAAVAGDLLVDIRPVEQREDDGRIPGADIVQRNAAEWRLDPRSPHRDPTLAHSGRRVIVICNEGYQSSLLAATLCTFGVDATDVIGGVQDWARSGLPIEGAQAR